MFKKILVANRGEIALRILRSCKELGIATVAIHSDVDQESLHVKFADESVCIGPADPRKSYLNIPAVISAAEITGADAIHPGYGFLAENPEFAAICKECGFHFIGPSERNIKRMGDKIEAKETAKRAGLPLIESIPAEFSSEKEALDAARGIGFPVIFKAAGGGGGRGMKIVRGPENLWAEFQSAKSEALAAFGNGQLYMEKFVENARHVEFQIIADTHGNIVHLGERDCSVQRRYQKLIEESPCPVLTPEVREKMGRMAVAVAREVEYQSVGTVEFLVDRDLNFYFLEMNTRIQVEHPVTEMVTGLDLVRLQIELAAGEVLPFSQHEVSFRGHAIECRINAEDPERFFPCTGRIGFYHPPGGIGVRVDSSVYEGLEITPYYDSILAKLIVHAPDRKQAIRRMQIALDEFVIEGVTTNIYFHKKMLAHERFISGDVHTQVVKELFSQRGK